MKFEKNSDAAVLAGDQQLYPLTSSRRTTKDIVDSANQSTRPTVKGVLLTLKRWYGKFHRKVHCSNEHDVIECHCQNRMNERKLTGALSTRKAVEDVRDAWDFVNENLENELRELAAKSPTTFDHESRRSSRVDDVSS